MPRLTLPALLVVSLALTSKPALAVQTPSDPYAVVALNEARLLGLSAEGTALWAKHIQQADNGRQWQKLDRIQVEFGVQLAKEKVDWPLLERLARDYSLESGRLARVRTQGTVDTALKLTGKDMRAIGAFLKAQSQRDLEPAPLSPDLLQTLTEAASAWYRSLGFSAEGAEMLIESSRKQSAGSSVRFKLQGAIGEHLAREQVDPTILNDLVAQSAVEEEKLALSEKRELIRVAGRLTPSDRQRFGQALVDASTGSINGKPVLDIVP
jgi:hypothetical protein